MLSRSSGYPDVLARPHAVYTRVDVWSGTGVLLAEDVPFVEGSVAATLTSRVARRLSLTLDEEFYPFDTSDLFAPFGNEVRAYRGVVYGDGLEEFWPVFRGRIHDADLNDDGQVSILALDRAADVVAAGFEGPHVTNPGLVVEEFRQLVRDVHPDATFVGLDAIHERIPRLIFEWDRGQGMDELAAAAGAFWFPLADGSFTMLRIPWTVDNPSQFTLADGAGGVVERSQTSRSREEVYNSITVFAERTDGSDPVVYTAKDQAALSPTFVDGNFGVRSKQVSVQGALNQAQARAVAESMLRRAQAISDTWALEITPDASIELGDTFTLACRDQVSTQVVVSFTLPLTAQGSMSMQSRSQVAVVN